MLEIVVPGVELWNEATNEFILTKSQKLRLEHSLVSVSKWEAKWCKVFLNDREKPINEIMDYIACMTITQNVDPIVYKCLTNDNVNDVIKYIEAPMTATHFREKPNRPTINEPVTSELIYYWMIAMQIPMECQKWHLNRLLALIRVCEIKNTPPKKMSKSEIMARNAALNAQRRAKNNSRG